MTLERSRELEQLLTRIRADHSVDLEAWESAIRAAVLTYGAQLLGEALADIGSGRQAEAITCQCGQRMESCGLRCKPILTVLGKVEFRRSMFRCDGCGATRYPGDEALDVVGTSRSPGLRRMVARAGSRSTFKEAQEDLAVYAEIKVSAKDVERVAEATGEDVEAWTRRERPVLQARAELPEIGPKIPILYISVDGTGVPMIPTEVQGRKGKQLDGSARTREVKLGCVFTQTTTDSEGRPIRDPHSTTFVGAIESAEEFGERIFAEAIRRGLKRAQRVVVLGDGALWIRHLVQLHFPQAIQILDLYHAREHLAQLSKLIHPADQGRRQDLRDYAWDLLDRGELDRLLKRLRALRPDDPEARRLAEQDLSYLESNRSRMQYQDYRAAGLFVGSGVVEAGCKTVIGLRLKRSGMEWSVRGANSIIALRCNLVSNRFDDYWEERAA